MNVAMFTNSLGLAGFSISSILYLLAVGYSQHKRILNIFAFLTFLGSSLVTTFSMFHASASGDISRSSTQILVVCLTWLAIAAQRQSRLRMMAAFMAPFVAFILLSQVFASSEILTPLESESARSLLSIHILASVVVQAFAVFASVMGILYLWKQRILKRRLIDRITGNIPSLNRLELYMMRLVWAGFVLATFSLITGAVFTHYFVDTAAVQLGGKTLWAVMLWAWLLSILLAKGLFHSSRKLLAQLCVVGFVVITVLYLALGYFSSIGGT